MSADLRPDELQAIVRYSLEVLELKELRICTLQVRVLELEGALQKAKDVGPYGDHVIVPPMRAARLEREVKQLLAGLRARGDIGVAVLERLDVVERALSEVFEGKTRGG